MKKFINTLLSFALIVCCTFFTACSDPSTPSNPNLKQDINTYLATLTTEYKQGLMTSMVNLQNNENATYTIDYDANHSTSNGTLKVGMECGYAPFNWTQNDASNGALPIANVDGKYANGYDVQIAAKVACALGMKLEIYQYEWESLVPAVKSGTLTAIIAGMSPTADRMEEIDFTTPYYQSNLVVITKTGSRIASYATLSELDQEGIKIAAQPGTFHYDALEEQTSNLTVESKYEDFNAMKMALEAGLIDGYIAEEPTAMAYCDLPSSDIPLTYIRLVNNSTGFTATDADVSIAIGLKK